MGFLTNWITNIILFILLAIIIEMLLPNSTLHKYVKMVTGLLLILVILTPLFQLLTADFDQVLASLTNKTSFQDENIENLVEKKKNEIQASQRAYILQQMAVQLKADIEEELVGNYGLSVIDIVPSVSEERKETINFEDITSIEIIVTALEDKESDVPVIKRIDIDTSKQNKPSEIEIDTNEVADLLATKWGIEAERIVVTVEGGSE